MILKNKIMRPAIAMLELIFAIVIIGIILMSAPMLISTATKSGYVAIQQEAINEAASKVNMIMGFHWDENSSDERYIDPILQVSNGDTWLDERGTTGRRPGTPEESYRAFVRSDGFPPNASVTLGNDGNKTDIDDFIELTHLVLETEPTLIADVVETTINLNTAISYNTDNLVSGGYNQSSIEYNPFNASGGTTNIKEITVTLTSGKYVEELEKKIILRAFSCNIGGYKLEERDF